MRTYFYSVIDNPPGSPNPTWLIEPVASIIGAEKIYDGRSTITSSNHLWKQGFEDAVTGSQGRPKIVAALVGLVMNGTSYR